MSADLIGWKGNVFDGQNCRCLKCYPSCDNALLVRVTPAITLCNDIFKSFEDAKKCCNLLAQQQNLPRLLEGNKHPNTRRVKCSGCKKDFMTFKNEPVRLLNHNSLVAYLEHSCKDFIPQSLSDDKVAINEAFHAEEEIMLHISPDSPATTNVESHDGTAFSKPNSSTLSKSVSFESNNQGNSVDPAMVEQENKPTTKQQAIYQETRKVLRPDGSGKERNHETSSEGAEFPDAASSDHGTQQLSDHNYKKKRRILISPEEVSEAKEVLKMLSDTDNWSLEKAQATNALIQSLMNRFQLPDLRNLIGGSDRHNSEPNAAMAQREDIPAGNNEEAVIPDEIFLESCDGSPRRHQTRTLAVE